MDITRKFSQTVGLLSSLLKHNFSAPKKKKKWLLYFTFDEDGLRVFHARYCITRTFKKLLMMQCHQKKSLHNSETRGGGDYGAN